MSTGKYRRHVLVLPEDQANSDIANGFLLYQLHDPRAIDVLPPAGGWSRVRDEFVATHIAEMRRRPLRYMVLMVDFDGHDDRLNAVQGVVPPDLADRVFVVGAWSNPEALRVAAGCSLEKLGCKLAVECCDGSRDAWNHELLRHNAPAVARMTTLLRPFLFPN
jgi:hypothetical protein